MRGSSSTAEGAAGPYGTSHAVAAAPSGINNRLPPQTADPYGSKPAPIGTQARTGQNFFSGVRNSSGIGSNQ